MALSVITRRVRNVIVLDVSGRLTAGVPVARLRTTIERCSEEGTENFVLNLAEVSHIDSAGVEELVMIIGWLRNRQGRVNLLNVSHRTAKLLEAVNLLGMFEAFDDEKQTVRSLDRARGAHG
jgi:anti-sigma B factor antagonist